MHWQVIDPWLRVVWEQGATDLLLTAGSPPRIRVDGRLRPIEGEPVLRGDDTERLVLGMLSKSGAKSFAEHLDVDFSFSWHDLARLRGNAFLQRGEVSLALRMIPSRIPTFEELGLPPVVNWLAYQPQGLILFTGPTGSGKSTTQASIIDFINQNREVHILTIEDPVEYVHDHKYSVVNQREVGTDCDSFDRALRSALREDPDVVLIGEMRDLESIQIALTLAETGHLIFGTLHTNDASTSLDRIIDVFPTDRQEQIRVQIAGALQAIVSQRLVRRVDSGLVAAFEVMMATHAVRNLIREGKTNQLRNVITTGTQDGMQTLEQSLAHLVEAGVINYEAALDVTVHPRDLARAVGPEVAYANNGNGQ